MTASNDPNLLLQGITYQDFQVVRHVMTNADHTVWSDEEFDAWAQDFVTQVRARIALEIHAHVDVKIHAHRQWLPDGGAWARGARDAADVARGGAE